MRWSVLVEVRDFRSISRCAGYLAALGGGSAANVDESSPGASLKDKDGALRDSTMRAKMGRVVGRE